MGRDPVYADPARRGRSAWAAYLYFVDSKRPVVDENAKMKVFSYDTDKINQLRSSPSRATSRR